MSKPKGKKIQREALEVVRKMIAPFGGQAEMDFSRRGGHQQIVIRLPNVADTFTIEAPSSPRDHGNCLRYIEKNCRRALDRYLMLS